MNIVKWALILTGLVVVLSLVLILTGSYTNPLVGGMGFVLLAIVFNVIVVFLALKQTASENTYLQQLLVALGIGVVACVLIFGTSLLLTGVVFPDYIDSMKAGYSEFIEASPMTEDQKATQLEALSQATALSQALPGAFGTFGTSLLSGLALGIFLRRK
jgi:hypothetical protein